MEKGYNPRVQKGISRKGKEKWDEEKYNKIKPNFKISKFAHRINKQRK